MPGRWLSRWEFWKRYVRYMEKTDVDRARGILERATLVHCKQKSDIHLFAAHFEERHGSPEKARERFVHIQTLLAPRLIPMIVQYANFERRQGNLEAACGIYEECIQEELAKETSETCVFLTIQYAHFLGHVVKDHARARAAIDKALAQKAALKPLWEGAIHFEECIWREDSISRICELYEKCVAPPEHSESGLEEADREDMSLRYIDFADMHCDAAKWAAVEELHAVRFPSITGTAESRKRPLTTEQEAAPAKAARTGMEGYSNVQPAQPMHPGTAAVPAVPQAPVPAQTYYPVQQQPAAAQQYAQQYAQYYGYPGYGYTGYGY